MNAGGKGAFRREDDRVQLHLAGHGRHRNHACRSAIMLEPSKNILYGWTMSDSELDESSEGQREKSVVRIELAGVAEVLRDLFNLLEQYAPTWYTEEHHNRAVAALRALGESRQVGKNEAARSQKAG